MEGMIVVKIYSVNLRLDLTGTELAKAVSMTENCELTICCRPEEWEKFRGDYTPYLCDRIRIRDLIHDLRGGSVAVHVYRIYDILSAKIRCRLGLDLGMNPSTKWYNENERLRNFQKAGFNFLSFWPVRLSSAQCTVACKK